MKFPNILASSLVITFLTYPTLFAEPAQTATEKKVEWKNLLEGENLSQWEKLDEGSVEDAAAWTITDGVLHLSKTPEMKKKGGSLVTIKHYQNFEMKFEFKISEAGNSGVKYRSLKNLGFEFQILDDKKHKDNKNPKNRAGSIYQLVAAPDDKKINAVGEWNQARIVVQGNSIEHWLNGEKTASLTLGSEDWKARYAASKYKKYPDFGKQGGEILLQDHNDEVWFRNLLIREQK